MDHNYANPLAPLLFFGVLAFGVYRRMRRTFGRQSVSVARMWVRIIIFTVIGGLVGFAAVRNVSTLEALLAGLCGGVVLAFFGLKHTQFEVTSEGRFYTPHTYIGLVVTALFLGRLIYRYAVVFAAGPSAMQGLPQTNPFAAYQNNPWTAATFGILVAYYILYYLGVLLKSRTPSQQPA